MKTMYFFDKQEWLDGPWCQEPDYRCWFDAETHYACVARRNVFGAWCGYVGLDWRHPLYETEIGSEEFKYIDVHGTVQFADWDKTEDVNFYPAERNWYVGFDCMQDDDLCPAFQNDTLRPSKRKSSKTPIMVYRDMNYVLDQIELLAKQLSSFDARFA
jgi:hypothetical protein